MLFFDNKTVLITGGSQGLGLAIAEELVRSARLDTLILVARDQVKLDQAKTHLESIKKSTKGRRHGRQIVLLTKSVDVTKYENVKELFNALPYPPEIVFCCAGLSKPGLFLEQNEQDFRHGIDLNYSGSLWTAQVSSKEKDQEILVYDHIFYLSPLPHFTCFYMRVCVCRLQQKR